MDDEGMPDSGEVTSGEAGGEPTVAPAEGQPTGEAAPAPEASAVDEALASTTSPDWAALPADFQPPPPETPPWQQAATTGPGQTPQVDWRLLNPEFVQSVKNIIITQQQTAKQYVATEAERRELDAKAAVLTERLDLLKAQTEVARDRWELQQEIQRRQIEDIKRARQGAVETLARQNRLDPKEVAFDAITGAPIMDPEKMVFQAQMLARQKYGERVQQRQQSGVDRAYAPTGGKQADDIASMDQKTWNAYKERVRRTGGRALYEAG